MKLPALAGPQLAIVGVALAGIALWWLTRPGVARDTGQAVGSAAVNVAAGVVEGVGEAVGVPRTDADACRQALADGDLWTASFVCPAGDFIKGLWGDAAGPDAPAENTGSVSGSW